MAVAGVESVMVASRAAMVDTLADAAMVDKAVPLQSASAIPILCPT
jgi:hypothetical protein